MPSTFTTNLGLTRISTGEQAGVWGNTSNQNFDFLDDAIDGVTAIILGSPAYTLSTVDGGDSLGRNKVLRFQGTLSSNCTITISPNDATKYYHVINDTTGGYSLIFQQGSGATYTLANGYANIIHADGGGASAGVTGTLNNLQVNNLQVNGSVSAAAGVAVSGNLSVSGNIAAGGTLTVTGAASHSGTTALTGAVVMGSTCGVVGRLTAAGGMTLNVGSDANYDMHVRLSDGTLGRIPIGSVGMYLRVQPSGLPGFSTVDTSLTIGTTPITGGTAGYVLHVGSGSVLSQSAGLTYNPSTGALAVGGPLSVGGAATVGGALTVTGAVTSGGALTANGNILANTGYMSFTNQLGGAAVMSIQAVADQFLFTKTSSGPVVLINNGFNMIRLHHTSHVQVYVPGWSQALIDGLLETNTAIFSVDGTNGQFVIRYKHSAGTTSYRIAASATP